MSERQRHTPHPLIVGPTLWAVDIPTHLKWPKLLELLKRCGEVSSGGRSVTPEGRRRWAIKFSDVYHAEMALATLNGVPVPNMDPPWNLTLSHTASLANALPTEPLCAQFVKASAGIHALRQSTAQDVFRWFRSAGPLVMVRTDVDVGYPQRTCMVQYWHETHASSALHHPRDLHIVLQKMPAFVLRTFAQCSVLVLNIGRNFQSADIKEVFGKFANVQRRDYKLSLLYLV
ncbi:hypothetical protein PHLGIDRAFT_213976 [Phlebiopsis gigantea 11061_1 CR5-6]|uniref:RRM domain-containing protein n=1 Tax=Phlebiopsis gigantea (strain 11061_1 CR5-6) TaxID=745531 RepID=A0A0C3PER6_PHLG1|nr:hypothetical protein PHLGIDRAFT_213976 [Phlebiopsis gigantea 11061_1 CR5-6]